MPVSGPEGGAPRSALPERQGEVGRWYWLGVLLLWVVIDQLFVRWASPSREAWAIKHVWLYLAVPALFLVATGGHRSIDWRWTPEARRWTLICCALVLPVYVGAVLLFPGMQSYYPMWPIEGSAWGLARYALAMLAIVVGTEFVYRGVMLLPLWRWGAWAVLFHIPPYVWIHVSKPPEEVVGSLFGGLLWGWAAYRSRTIYPGLISHGLGWMILELGLAFGGS